MFKKIILIISILFFYISIVEACSCRIPEEPTKKEIFDSYDNILIWKLLKIEEKKINIKEKTLNNNTLKNFFIWILLVILNEII